MATRRVLAAVLLVLVAAVATQAHEQERLPTEIQRDVLEALGNQLVEDSPSDSIQVVSHNYWSPPSDEHSLLHAAESVSHRVAHQLETAELADYAPKEEMVQASYTDPVDPAFLVETHSFERTLGEEAALEATGRWTKERAEEMAIGLVEEAAEINQPANTAATQAAQPPAAAAAPKKMIVVSQNYEDVPVVAAPVAAPTAPPKQYVTPIYKRTPAPAPTATPLPQVGSAAPKPTVTYTTPLYKEDHPRVVAARARAARRAEREARRAARQAAIRARQWSVAPVIRQGLVQVQSAAPAPAAPQQYITPAVKSARVQRSRRRCIRRDPATKKCTARCRRCAQAPKPIQYMSPSFYAPRAKRVPVPDRRVLVNTPAGPVYVLYVTRHRRRSAQATPAAAPAVQVSAPVTSFAQAPRAAFRVQRGGATYVLPHAPVSPYAAQAAAYRRAQLARAEAAARRRAARIARHMARRQARLAREEAAARLRAQQRANTEYDPRTHTVIRHNHHHHFTRGPATAPVPVLRRAYVKLCRLQKAILTKYNAAARRAARRAKRQAREQARKAASTADAVTAASAMGDKYAPSTAAAEALQKKYAAHLARYRRARKLIKRASAFLKKRAAERHARRVAIVHCRLHAHRNGQSVPKCLGGGGRRRRRSVAILARRRRVSLAERRRRIRAAKKRCRKLAKAAGLNVPYKCQSSKKTQAVFRKNRYDPKTNKIRFQQTQANAEAQAEAQAESQTESQTESQAESTADSSVVAPPPVPAGQAPVEGLDFNQSPLIKKLLAQLKEQKIL